MAVAPLSASSSLAAANPLPVQSAGNDAFLTNYENFLKMLTAQLRVQNPLDPMDAEKFTQQLVQFSSVEQQIKTNQNLESMLATLASSTALSLINYLGKTVEAASDITQLKGGTASWTLNATKAADQSLVTIRNASGAIVHESEISLKKGENTFTWNGELKNGQQAPDGAYQVTVTAKDGNGNAVPVQTRVKGTVSGIDTSGPEPYLKIGETVVPLSSLLTVEM